MLSMDVDINKCLYFIFEGFKMWNDLHGASFTGLGMHRRIMDKPTITLFIINSQGNVA